MNPIIKYGIVLRLVTEEDAEFILKLRTDPNLNKYISYTCSFLTNQVKWIQNYKMKEKQGLEYYFIAQNMAGTKYGTIRLCNFEEKSFELGSWVFMPNSPLGIAVKAHLIGLETGFELLKADYCRITVRKNNVGVVRYLDVFQPKKMKEDDLDYYFCISKENFYYSRKKMSVFS